MSLLFQLTAWGAVLAIVVYLLVYSALFSWWKSTYGRLLNGSLVFTAIAGLGVLLRSFHFDLGRIVSFVGWLGFTVLLLWRLQLLVRHYLKEKGTVHEHLD